MKITFVVRLHSHNGDRLGFYVPKSVFEFYELKVPYGGLNISGTIEWRSGPPTESMTGELSKKHELPDIGTKLYEHPNGLRGVIPRWANMPDPGTLVELSIAVA